MEYYNNQHSQSSALITVLIVTDHNHRPFPRTFFVFVSKYSKFGSKTVSNVLIHRKIWKVGKNCFSLYQTTIFWTEPVNAFADDK